MKILLADDEKEILKALRTVLERNNYTVDCTDNGEDACELALAGDYDGIILDIMMPGKDGLTVLTELRKNGSSAPVMLLTAKSELSDRVAGFESGADDYLPKPFDISEFLVRVKALLRRKGNYVMDIIKAGDLSLNCTTCEISAGGGIQKLNNKEFQIMEYFVRNPEQIFSTEQLMEKLWGWDSDTEINVVWTNIANLRRKLHEIGSDTAIVSVRGIGYRLEEKNA